MLGCVSGNKPLRPWQGRLLRLPCIHADIDEWYLSDGGCCQSVLLPEGKVSSMLSPLGFSLADLMARSDVLPIALTRCFCMSDQLN